MHKNMDKAKWDYIIITVNNYKQKKIAEKEILKRRKIGLIKNEKVIIIVASKRLKTGSMLLKALKKVNTKNKKILYIPSAGKVQRTLYYFKKGKLWIKTDEVKTIFDEILLNTRPILRKMAEGILICCSDVVLKFTDEIKMEEKEKVYAFSTRTKAILGTKHGTFRIEKNIVKEVLQKASLKTLRKKKFIKRGKINIDTGMLIIPNNVLEYLKKEKLKSKKIDIYVDLIPKFCKEKILNVILLQNAKFMHYGSSKDIIKLKSNKNKNYFENTIYKYKKLPKNVLIFNSEITVKIPNNVIIYTTKIRKNKWITIIYGINDDIKAKDSNIKMFGVKIYKKLELKTNSQISFWNLKLYKSGNTKTEALDNALKLYDLIKNKKIINIKNAMSIEEILKKEI